MEAKEASRYEIDVVIDGKRVATSFFVKEILGGGIDGMVRALKGVDDPRRIEITVECKTDE